MFILTLICSCLQSEFLVSKRDVCDITHAVYDVTHAVCDVTHAVCYVTHALLCIKSHGHQH